MHEALVVNSQMLFIAIIHLLWLTFVPIGTAFLVKAVMSRQRRGVAVAAGIVLLILSTPAVLHCREMSPLDFLGLGKEVRVAASSTSYTVWMVQKPGYDFYDSFLEIQRADGKITRLMVDADDSKLWGLRAETRGSRTDFITTAGEIVSSVDFATGTLAGALEGETTFDQLDFNRRWSNGGS